MKIKLLAILLVALAMPFLARGQAQWNGLAPSQAGPTPLSIRVADGDLSSVIGTSTFTAQTFLLQPNATNYVYLDLTTNPPQEKQSTTGFPAANYYPIATVVTNLNRILTVTDSRPKFNTFMFSGVLNVTIAPTGACSNGSIPEQVISTGVIYTCQGAIWSAIGGVVNVAVAPSGACTNGTVPQMVISTGVIYTCQASVWGAVTGSAAAAGTQGQLQLNNSGALGVGNLSENSSILTNGDDNLNRGPNPSGVDVRFFGARPINLNIIPAPTATANAGSNQVVVSSVSGLQVKDGFDVVGAGAAQSMTTPVAPTVTPSCASNMTGLGLTVPVPGGATAYAYSLSLIDQGRGWTAASANGTTSTGNATLGARSTAITSIAAGATNTFTATVASTAELAAGCMVEIDSTTDDGEFGGWKTIASIVDGTHFTYTSGVDASRGISATTATGGTVRYWLCNHIVMPTPGAGGTQYMVFGNTAGSMAYLGLSLIANLGYVDATYNSFDDYGATMMASPTRPWWAPTTPPASPVNDLFVSTITNIAGTTLTMAGNATTSVTTSPARFDDTPGILAAQAAANTFSAGGGGVIRFPVATEGSSQYVYIISSPLTLTAKSVIEDTAVATGDTIILNGTVWTATDMAGIRELSGTFAMRPHIPIFGNGANPMIYLQNGAVIDNAYVAMFGNVGVGVFNAQQNSSQVFHNDFFGSAVATSYLSIPFYDYADRTAGSFGGDFKDTNFSCGYAQATGSTATPAFVTKFGSQWNFDTIYANRCGFVLFPSAGSNMFRFYMGHEIQGNTMPLVTVGNINTGTGAGNNTISLNLKNMWIDTGQSTLANFGSGGFTIGGNIVFDTADFPGGGAPLITGQPFFGSINLIGMPIIATANVSQIGQNINVNIIGGANGSLNPNNGGYAGITAAGYGYPVIAYSANHTIAGNEGAVKATATLTFTLPHALKQSWDIFSITGTTTLSIDSGTLFGNAATGNIIIPNNTGLRAFCDGTNCYAIGPAGGGAASPGGLTDALQYNGGGVPATLAGVNSPTTNGNYIVNYNVTASAAVPPTITLPGVPINPQTGTTYTYLYSDRGSVVTASNAGAQTYTLVNPSASGFGSNYFNVLKNIWTGAVTETASGFTVNGGASLLVPPSWTRFLWSDGVNYIASRFPDFGAFPNCTGGGNALQFTLATGVFSCGSASAGVSSFSGDGALLSNSLSTGAVTATLANAGAHKFWMNNTGISAAPGYQSPGKADLLGTIVYNDQANTYSTGLQDFSAATMKLPAGGGFTAGATTQIGLDTTNKNIHVYANNADAIACAFASAPTTGDVVSATVVTGNVLCSDTGFLATNVVRKDAANTGAAAMTLDMSGATGATALKVPVIAGATAGADGVIDYDSTNKNTHVRTNGADSIVCAFSAAPTTGDLVSATIAAGNTLCSDSGTLAANVVTAASGATAAKQTCVASGASKTCSYIDFPEHLIIPAANCNNATAGAGWSIPATNAPTVACRAGTNNLGGVLQWANNNTTTNAQFTFQLPFDWDTATQPYWNIVYGSGANTSGTIKWTISTGCTKSDGSVTDDPTFVAESTSGGKTMAAANRMWSENAQFANLTSGNSCIAGSTVILKVTSGNGTATSTVNVEQITITVPRLLTVQAN